MNYKNIDNIVIEDAQIIFRNFAGVESQYNRAGNRSFNVIIDDVDMANKLIEDGWNVKQLKARDVDEAPKYRLEIFVSFGNFPPNVFMITTHNKTRLDEDMLAALDYAELKTVDLVIRPYQWEVNGKSGIKAYLKTGYFVVDEDEQEAKIEAKYSDPEIYIETPF